MDPSPPSTWTTEVLDEFALTSGLTLDRGVRARHFAASDWGGIVMGGPAAVIRPRSTGEVARVAQLASKRGLKLTPRGTGASSGGQAVAVNGSVTLDLTGLDDLTVDAGARTVSCGPGATWRSALSAAFAHGLQPTVMPLQLDLTIGGTLSVGGFGTLGHRFGVAASHAVELEVVTGDGRVLRCRRDLHPDLFDAVRAGLGRCGVITRATLALRPATGRVRVVRLRSRSHASWSAALESLGARYGSDSADHVVHVEGFCRPEGADLVCDIHLGIEHDDGAPDGEVPLPPEVKSTQITAREDWGLLRYPARRDPRFDEMVAAGHTGEGHPWIEALLAPDTFAALLPEVMAGIAGDAADRIQAVLIRRDLLPPMVAAPPGDLLVAVVIVPRGIPRDDLPRAMAAMERVNDLLIDAGGRRYLAGWLPRADEQAWRRHFGPLYDGWLATRRSYDPAGTFTSALFADEG